VVADQGAGERIQVDFERTGERGRRHCRRAKERALTAKPRVPSSDEDADGPTMACALIDAKQPRERVEQTAKRLESMGTWTIIF
jgi:hypothetical protein